jgi:WD40 repeat protein
MVCSARPYSHNHRMLTHANAQSKANRLSQTLVVCKHSEKRVLFKDMDSNWKRSFKITRPLKCATSQRYIAVSATKEEVNLFDHDGDCIGVVSESDTAFCIAFHPIFPEILALGFGDGSVCFWNVDAMQPESSFDVHSDDITRVAFSSRRSHVPLLD